MKTAIDKSVMIGEEQTVILGNATTGLGLTPLPTLSAAGAVEAVFTLLTLQHQRIPPTINYQVPDPAIPLDVVPNKARDAHVTHAISNSFGFGGQNVSLVMGLEPAA